MRRPPAAGALAAPVAQAAPVAAPKAGLAAAPADAAPEVRKRCQYVAPSPGGHGAVRNLVEEIFKARGLWDKVVDEYLLAGQGDKQ